MRTTIRWLATPRRTRLPSLCVEKKLLRAAASASTSVTSPSRTMPGASGETAARRTVTRPFTVASAAAMWLGSMSSPTTVRGVFLAIVVLREGRCGLACKYALGLQASDRPFVHSP